MGLRCQQLKKINYPNLILAILVISMFCGVGIAMAYQSYLWMILFTLFAILIMGFGFYLKSKKRKSDS